MSWSYLHVSDPDEAYRISMRSMELAFSLRSARNDRTIVVFSRLDYEGGTHFYFSPSTATVAKVCGANDCTKPSREVVGKMLFGNPKFDFDFEDNPIDKGN